MRLSDQFEITAPVERVWSLFDDLQRVVPCMPGATLLGIEDEDIKVGMKVKIGVISSNFASVVRFTERDASTYTAVLQGSGKDTGGKGAASATITSTLMALDDNHTRVHVETDLALTGRIAQFGGPVLVDISSRIVSQFAANLQHALMTNDPDSSAKAKGEGTTSAPQPVPATTQPLDLGNVVLQIVLGAIRKYGAVAMGAFFAGWLTGRFF
jgi:carbon monoxide dehydrogenase subunit G